MTRNVSRSGAFLLTTGRWAPDSLLRLKFVYDDHRFVTDAKVRFAADDGVALAFHEPDTEFTTNFERFLDGLANRDLERVHATDPVIGWRPLNRVNAQHAPMSSLTLDGAAVDTAAPPDVGQILWVSVSESTDQPVECQAEVVRHTGSGFAVRFVEPSRGFRAAVRQLRRTQASKSS